MVFVRRRKGVLCWDCARERTFTANGPALGPGIEETLHHENAFARIQSRRLVSVADSHGVGRRELRFFEVLRPMRRGPADF